MKILHRNIKFIQRKERREYIKVEKKRYQEKLDKRIDDYKSIHQIIMYSFLIESTGAEKMPSSY